MSKGAKKKNPKGVLSDHQKVGRKFVPPLMQLGPFKDANWIGSILPELLWLGLLNDHFGIKKGAALALSLARAAEQARKPERKMWFALTSAYLELNDDQKKQVVMSLKLSLEWELLIEALSPLASLYPRFPLGFLFEGAFLSIKNDKAELEKFKTMLSKLFDKYDKPATFVEATAVYIALITEKLFVFEGLTLARFPEVEKFPDTDDSKLVAASIRSTVNGLWGSEAGDSYWPGYFWNRGLELEPCDYQGIYAKYE